MPLTFRPKLEKIVELLLYLAHARPGADKYQAVKFFYLADREHLNRYGRPITYEEYCALPYGPVASKTMDLLNGSRRVMQEARVSQLPFATRLDRRPGKADLVVIGEPHRAVDFDLFSKSDIKVFDEILAKYGKLNFGELFDLTHGHKAYRRAWKNRPKGANASRMLYEEMIESPEKRTSLLHDLEPISRYM